MSIFWTTRYVGADGDLIYARPAVNQWQSREDFEAETDRQLAKVREEMLSEFDRLTAGEEQD